MTASELLALIPTLKFRPFGPLDWQCFAGCESEKPFIAETETEVIIIDGDKIVYSVVDTETEQLFELSKTF